MLLALIFVCLFVGNEALKFEVKFSPTRKGVVRDRQVIRKQMMESCTRSSKRSQIRDSGIRTFFVIFVMFFFGLYGTFSCAGLFGVLDHSI